MKLRKITDDIISKLDPEVAYALGKGSYDSAARRLLLAEGLERQMDGYSLHTGLGEALATLLQEKIERDYPEPKAEPEPEPASEPEPEQVPAPSAEVLPDTAIAFLKSEPAPQPLPHGYAASDIPELR